jgi:uncharacterized membrane protein (UPF0127 family)
MTEDKTKMTVYLFLGFIVVTILTRIWLMRWPRVELVLDGQEITAIHANTPERRYQGLGGRDALLEDAMLFSFPSSARYAFVMRDTKFPIDIVWLQNGVVVDIAPNVQPEPGVSEEELTRYYPRTEANAVLEFSAGWVAQHELMIGDRLYAAGDEI